MNTQNLTRDDLILGGVALLLLIDLLLLPWFSISVGPFGPFRVTATFTATATDAPDGWAGILAVLILLALIADLAVERFSPQTMVPSLGNGREDTRFALVAGVAVLLLLKFLLHISNFGDLGFGFWVAVVLTAGLVYLTHQARAAGLGVAGRV